MISVYLITGVTGYIGRMFTKALLQSEEYKNGKISVLGLCRDEKKAEQYFEGELGERFKIIKADILDLEHLVRKLKEIATCIHYIIHCAANTTSSYMVSNPVETCDGIVIGTRNILEIARMYEVERMVYISSMEVYGYVEASKERVTEDNLGDIDILSSRSCYPLGKRLAEHYCYIYYKEYGVRVSIARLAQTFGKGISREDRRIFAQIAKAVINEQDIVLHTLGESMGNYCSIEDAINGIFCILSKGELGEAYNVVNPLNTMKIRDMAYLVANSIADGSISVTYDIQNNNANGYAVSTGLRLSAEKLMKLGWKPKKDLIEMYREVINELRQ
ncbi:MAG: NAD(P)-dependent oxidoreductase [Lachnospiraceae bacterium]|nr:NAD(P)-dependent oxidoreductase [Lachnospiraceae bacterium]